MDIWKLLGIPPTEDISKIKSAYARQAKQCHPEEHPEEFKALQNAYKAAVQIAKSRKAAGKITYMSSGQTVSLQADQLKPEEDWPKPKVNWPESETDQPELESDWPKPEADQPKPETDRPKPEEAQEEDRQRMEKLPEAGQPKQDQPKPEAAQNEARTFDFSGVDTYGEREHFLRQFLLLAKNPYLKNKVEMWDCFLNRNAFADLFPNTEFRKELVQTLCGLYGWRRKTILYFERFLSTFHTEESKPNDGEWETQLRAFRRKKRPRLRLPAFCMDRFWLKEGRNFHKQLRRRVCQLAGREIDLDVKLDMVRYMELYLAYGKEMESYIDRLYGGWRFEQILIACFTAIVCLFIAVSGAFSTRHGRGEEARMNYLYELYGMEPENYSEEEQKEVLREYNDYWKYAEDAIDDALERYEEWSGYSP